MIFNRINGLMDKTYRELFGKNNWVASVQQGII